MFCIILICFVLFWYVLYYFDMFCIILICFVLFWYVLFYFDMFFVPLTSIYTCGVSQKHITHNFPCGNRFSQLLNSSQWLPRAMQLPLSGQTHKILHKVNKLMLSFLIFYSGHKITQFWTVDISFDVEPMCTSKCHCVFVAYAYMSVATNLSYINDMMMFEFKISYMF